MNCMACNANNPFIFGKGCSHLAHLLKGCCQLQAKECPRNTGSLLMQAYLGSVVLLTDHVDRTIDVKPQIKRTKTIIAFSV